MKQIKTQLTPDRIPEALQKAPDSSVLFFDIETTGFSPKSSFLYLIGASFYDSTSGHFFLNQWLAENRNEEKELLRSFLEFLPSFQTIVHFNGTTFDIPFIKARMERYSMTGFHWDEYQFADLYRKYSPYKHFFSLTDNRQKTWEQFLGTGRKDLFNGGDLITLYDHYTEMLPCEQKTGLEKILLLHNFEDVEGLLSLTWIDCYLSIFDGNFRIDEISVSEYPELDGTIKKELYLNCTLPVSLPSELSFRNDYYYMKISEDCLKIRIPLYEGTFYHFYPDYQNYYYLPAEDMAVHKSVASFVEKAYRVRATPENCRKKLSGAFIRQPGNKLFSPVFYESYEKKNIKKGHASFSPYRNDMFDEKTLASFLRLSL